MQLPSTTKYSIALCFDRRDNLLRMAHLLLPSIQVEGRGNLDPKRLPKLFVLLVAVELDNLGLVSKLLVVLLKQGNH